ncbi:branched-chain amino acid ABC transporter permease [Enemella evansiae]|uniref:Branched-chain amino acid ABC transporter permease n=1 Tax=Enemella evansiae TaxID=2016499 RepID=A0A255GBV9_9ACTN|nr:branched-chain amino acid ABC transporter permease [Enemella evansiae]PFG68474.1 branched-chain amino acid transport system permease protein [Propionibacteriaceae bacterium ES.041]OYN95491.1 branched-chain amino acid ABC transporter permease [Enemella evansiae]OYO01656.1 branched-chain amino acid ABC transporter permease [Enemella evansiae]OYO03599.1 branched-chain amino acid ABC transporter permease [Enemella evansiae]OYO13369.1 branched-chain amino acid ABC transporter permease [Enemella 
MELFSAYAVTAVNGLALGAVLFIVAIGLSLVFGTMDVLNLAHGSVSLIGAYVGVALLGGGASSAMSLVAVLVAAVIGLLAGILLAVLTQSVTNHLRQAMLTLGVAMIVADLLLIVFGADVKSVPPPPFLSGEVPVFGAPYPIYRLLMIAIGLVVGIGLWLILEKTRIGAVVRATVADRAMVEATGIRTRLVLAGVFGGGAALAAVGGLIAAPLLGAQPGNDDLVLLYALVIVVIGGLGSFKGAAVGALLVGQVQTVGVSVLASYASFLMFAVMALVLLLKPAGLLPARHGGGH